MFRIGVTNLKRLQRAEQGMLLAKILNIKKQRSVNEDDLEAPVGDYTIDGEILFGDIFLKHVF